MDEKEKSLQIRNSTAEFLIFSAEAGENTIEVRVEDGTVWLTQKLMAELFKTSPQNITMHLKKIYQDDELQELATCKESLQVQQEGNRQVSRKAKFYNLDAIIAVGFKVNSNRAVQFRQWAIEVLRRFSIRGYVLDKERMENGTFLSEDYFEHLLEEIREIRASERRFYQKITDIYATAMDYHVDAPTTQRFFATVQNKLHFAIHGHTAAEVIVDRADHQKAHMGLTTWKNAPDGKIVKSDVSVAKNYLSKDEIEELNRIVTMYLDYAEDQARRHIPMTMEDWEKRLHAFLQFNERELLQDAGRVTAEIAKAFAESEFEKYRVVQDQLYESDYDRLLRGGELDGLVAETD